tara:strand:- start:107 stop:1192 length:1086 start_codon:yes stop_codon:yes gene_type:complete
MAKINLTEEQEQAVLNEWNSRPENPPSLLELIQAAYPGTELDGRSKEGKAVKTFLAGHNIQALAAHQYQPKKIELSEEHKEFVRNNFSTMSAVEIARVLFADRNLTNLNQESRAVDEYIKTLNPAIAYDAPTQIPESTYKPPKTQPVIINKVNKFVHEGIDKNKILPSQKKGLQSLIGYLHTYRFLHQINNYEGQTDRELFESSFIRYTYDKHDLTQEEVDQYIVLSTEVVIASNIQRRVERLQQHLDNSTEDTEGRRIAMALVEAINTAQTEYNQCVNRQQKLLESLKEKRSDRLKKQIGETASILNLVEMWKEEKTREKMIKMAELRKQTVKDEIENISTMDEMKAKIMGISEEEILDG